jgi:hypothetical protein
MARYSRALTLQLMGLFLAGQAIAGTIRGHVVSKEGTTAVVGANVSLPGTHFGTTTSPDGDFTIPDVPAGSYLFRVSMIGADFIADAEHQISATYLYVRQEEAQTRHALQTTIDGSRGSADLTYTNRSELRTQNISSVSVGGDHFSPGAIGWALASFHSPGLLLHGHSSPGKEAVHISNERAGLSTITSGTEN